MYLSNMISLAKMSDNEIIKEQNSCKNDIKFHKCYVDSSSQNVFEKIYFKM